ncbi:MAG: cysteine--tRNA ligase [Solirubrobacterales bacterium]|nr:cysteine--tRNA ligase [Solirubrobacterales bacterium]
MTREIRLHDTLRGGLAPLVTREPGKVGIYACGPTVYGRVHVGNARPFVVFSLLKRFLVHEGYQVTLVSNITDVNDKIYAAADGLGSEALAREMTAAYVADTDGLGLGRPDHEPTATGTMAAIIELIELLIARGHAYEAGGDVYFSVKSYARYGELSHRRVEDMDQGEGVEGAELKRHPSDFAMWKATKPGEDTAWDSPWGRGRPGWHIECSAMAEQLLGMDFEIHGGGSDLAFPHHENEAAQSGAAHGGSLARLWMHNGMIQSDAEKMAKSVGNIFLLSEALQAHGRDALIMYFVSGHYRKPVDYDADRLEAAGAQVARIREVGRKLVDGASPDWSAVLVERFFDALADDFNTPGALAHVWEWIRSANSSAGPVGRDDLAEMLEVLGLSNLLDAEVAAPPEAVALAEQRDAARAARDFARADALRDQLKELGWEVRDSAGGPELLPL